MERSAIRDESRKGETCSQRGRAGEDRHDGSMVAPSPGCVSLHPGYSIMSDIALDQQILKDTALNRPCC
jgi:hypothetical protein